MNVYEAQLELNQEVNKVKILLDKYLKEHSYSFGLEDIYTIISLKKENQTYEELIEDLIEYRIFYKKILNSIREKGMFYQPMFRRVLKEVSVFLFIYSMNKPKNKLVSIFKSMSALPKEALLKDYYEVYLNQIKICFPKGVFV